MNRIDTLQIHNFKFFQAQDAIKLGGNHMLLYGENGSGKSSVYWSLYTLFEASLKPDDIQIRKYFSKTLLKGEDCLVNIHAQETAAGSDDYNSFIEVKTDDATPVTFRISYQDFSIRGNHNAKQINYASDYINYRLLLGFSSFPHSEPIDLFELFANNIFYYVRFPAINFTRDGDTQPLTSPVEMWRDIVKGPNEFDFNHTYLQQDFEDYIDTQAYKDYSSSFDQFHVRLQALIDYINLHAPDYLKKLGYSNFEFQLDLKRSFYTLTAEPKEYYLHPFSIALTITEYDGVPKAVRKPHSFLNEARFSAMAIAIRLAILKQKLQEDCLKFIVLDDLLISLDMSNREKVLEVILSSEFSLNYQLIILTHDYSFFQLAKRKVSDAAQTNWTYYELYVDEDKNLPVLLPSDTSFTKACNHLKSFDYPAAGNYFRKATEEIFENYFPREVTIADNGEKRTTLKGYLDAAIRLYERIGRSTALLKTLDNYLFLLLNPLSHRAIDANVYKVELSRVRSLLPELISDIKHLNLRELVAANNQLVIHFIQDTDTQFEYFINTSEAIYLCNTNGQDVLTNSKCRSFQSSTIVNDSAPVIVNNNHYDSNHIEVLHRSIYAFNNLPYDNTLMTNIYHVAQHSKQRRSLQNIVNAL